MFSNFDSKMLMYAKSIVINGHSLIVLSTKSDGAGTPRLGWSTDNFEGEAFDERRSGLSSIMSEACRDLFWKSCQLPWCGVGDLTEEREAWAETAHEDYLKFMNDGQAALSAEEFSAKFVADLVWLNKTFGRIYAFEDMANNFLAVFANKPLRKHVFGV